MARHTTKKINTNINPPADATEDSGDYITLPEHATTADAHYTGYLNPFSSKPDEDEEEKPAQ